MATAHEQATRTNHPGLTLLGGHGHGIPTTTMQAGVTAAAVNHHPLLNTIKTKDMREPLEAVQNILNQNRNLAYEIVLNQRLPTIESLTHSNLLIQHYDGNLKQIVEIYKQMGDNVTKLLPKG